MKDSHLLVVFALSTMLALTVLALREETLARPGNHDWWSLAFVSEEASDASFTVLNFGPNRTFFYEALLDEQPIKSAFFTLGNESGQTIVVSNPDKKSVRINVWTEGEQNKKSRELGKRKEIYKKEQE